MFESLRSLSDSQIITGSKISRAQEHSGLLAMIGFIAETERRQLFLRRGHSSLFDYCMKELGYSESQAIRRITAARCVVRFPEAYELLKVNEINLGTISRVFKILTPENGRDVLESIRKKSLREVDAILAERAPVAAFPRDRVRTIVARVPGARPPALGEIHLRSEGEKDPAAESPVTNEMEPDAPIVIANPAEQAFKAELFMQDTPSTPSSSHKLGDSSPEHAPAVLLHKPDDSSAKDVASVVSHRLEDPSAKGSTGVVATERLERRARVEFTARPELMEKLERVRALASHRVPVRPSIEQLIDFMADYIIRREDPCQRHERRQARRMRRAKAPD